MSIFEQLMAQARGMDLNAVAQRVGLDQDQLIAGARALLPQIANPDVDNQQATAEAAAQTGIDPSQLAAIVPALLEQARNLGAAGGPLQNVLAGLGGGAPASSETASAAAPGDESILGKIGKAIDRDGDGNPINDIMGMLGRR